MSDYTDEKFVKILRHLATQLPAYWVVSCEGVVNSKKLKEALMDEFKMPESSARACVNVAKSNSIGLIWYCKEDDSFELDAEAVDEFYDNMDVLLSRNARENKRIKELEKELSEIRNSYYRQKKTLDRYIKVYGEDVMNV